MNEFQNYIDPLSKKLRELEKEGFDDQFVFHGKNLQSSRSKQSYGQKEVKIIDEFRFEGESNPSDMSILYAIQTSDGNKGTLVDAFGTYGDDELEEFLKAVQDNHIKNL